VRFFYIHVLLYIMQNSILYFLFSLISACGFSQSQDTLSNKTNQELFQLMQKTGFEDIDKGLEVGQYYLNKTSKDGDDLERFKALSLYILTCIQGRKFNYFESQEVQLADLAAKKGFDKQLMEAYFLHADNYFYQGLFGKAIETYYKSFELAKRQDDIVYKHLNLKQIGYLNYFTGKLKESIRLQKEAIALLYSEKAIRDSVLVSSKQKMELRSLELLTRTFLFAKQKDSARVYNDKAFKMRMVEDSCFVKIIIRQRAAIFVLERSFDKAKESLEQFKAHCFNPKSIDAFFLASEYGKIYLELKAYDKAVEVLNKGLEGFSLEGQEAFATSYLKLLALAYKHQGDVKKSNFYFEKFVNANEDYGKIKDTVAARVKSQEVKAFKTELNAIQSEKETQESYLKYLAFGATLVILVLLFMLLRFYKIKNKNELKFQELLAKVNVASVKANIVDTKDSVLEGNGNANDVNEVIKQQILQGLQKLEEQDYFLQQDCNSYNVAKKIKTNTSYLSKVVNSHFQKNFNTYINDLRINYAVVRLKNDSQFRHYSIQSIAEELGYKSADSFTKYFKKHTGLNPSFYIKQLNAIV